MAVIDQSLTDRFTEEMVAIIDRYLTDRFTGRYNRPVFNRQVY